MRRWFTSTFAFLGILSGIFLVGCTGSSSPPITVTITNPASSPTIEGGQTVNVTTSVSNDSANKGVTWSLSGQGSLTNQTSTSVTYKAPASVASNIMATVTAMSVADTSKSAAISITVAAVSVTIRGKVMQLAAANTTLVLFSAAVQNDPSNGGVTWTLMSNGTLCSPACGSLSLVTGFDVFYRPPASVPGAPNNMPTIAATSVTDPTKSDIDAFTIFDGATACAPGGSESLLNGEYAILLQGWTGSGAGKPTMFAASFGADGAGKITGGIATVNDFTSSSSGGSLIASASSYSVGPDGRGCLTLTNESEDGTFTFHFSLGRVSGGIASKGNIVEFDNQRGNIERGSGILRRQDPTAFSLSALAPNYALGVNGWENSKGPLNHFALVGSFAQSGGSISSPSFDANDGGALTSLAEPGVMNFGTIQPINAATGWAPATLLAPGTPGFANVNVYVINSSEFFVIATDISSGGAAFSGRAIAMPSSFSANPISPNYIFHFTGSSSGAASASIGLASFSGGLSGTVSGSIDQYAGGTASHQNLTGTFAFTDALGRLAINGGSAAMSPVCYLTNPFDNVSAFCISTDATAGAGVFDTQPAAPYNDSSLSGNLFFGSNEPGDNTVPDLSGVASISSGNLTGKEDTSAPAGLSLGSALNATLSISTNGTGNLGTTTVAVTNGIVLYFISEAGGAPAEVQVFEP